MPSRCAIAETPAPCSNASATARALKPASAKLPRCTLKAVGNSFGHMEGSSSRAKRRHRSSQQLIVSVTDIRPLTPLRQTGVCLPLTLTRRYPKFKPLPILRPRPKAALGTSAPTPVSSSWAATALEARSTGAQTPAAIRALMCRMSEPQQPPTTRNPGSRSAISA